MKQPKDKKKLAGIVFQVTLLVIILFSIADFFRAQYTLWPEPVRLGAFLMLAMYVVALWNAVLWIRHFKTDGLKSKANWSIFFTILIFLNPLSLLFLFFVSFAFVFGEVLAV